jgi:hypothetical protein
MFKANPSLSFPNIFKDQYQLKGFYRFINNKSISHNTFIESYKLGLVQYSNKQKNIERPWILIQDSMFTDFHDRKLDMGYTQTENSNGNLIHIVYC